MKSWALAAAAAAIDLVVRRVRAGRSGCSRGSSRRRASPPAATRPICSRRLRDGHGPDVDAVDADRARRDVPQPRDEPHERRLARARRADEGEGLARRRSSRSIVAQHGALGVVPERHAVERDPPADGADRRASGRIDDRRARVDDLEDARDGAGPLAELPVQRPRSSRGSPPIATPYSRKPGERPDRRASHR